MSDVQSTLAERGARYGDFTDHAAIAQALQDTMRLTRPNGWNRLNDVQRQALTVIADKIARILSGDPNYADNWHDIQGYARLVEDRLELIDKVVSGEVKLVVNPAPTVDPRWFDGYPEMPTWRSAPHWATHRLQAAVGLGYLWFWVTERSHTPGVFDGYQNLTSFTEANIIVGTLEARPKC